MVAIFRFIDEVLIQLLIWVIIAGAIMSWLIAFNVINVRNPLVNAIWNSINALTEPMIRPIRRILPNTGAVDIAPLVLVLGLILIQYIIRQEILPRL
jgi:YggT family protein